MTFEESIQTIAEYIRRKYSGRPLFVGVDGIDAAGKTTLADSLAEELRRGGLPVIRASIDGFHNPRDVRYARGSLSPEGYFFDSFNYDALKNDLLLPLREGSGRDYRLKAFDFTADTPVDSPPLAAPDNGILIFEGVFLFRPELAELWDIKIFVDVSFEEALRRAMNRDLHLFKEKAELERRYTQRYIPGQRMYLNLCHPMDKADILVRNEDFTHPICKIIR